ncbi:MAG: YHYH protein [Planctomycetota bacterium]
MSTSTQETPASLHPPAEARIDHETGERKRWTTGDSWLIAGVTAMILVGLCLASVQAHEVDSQHAPGDSAWLDGAAWAELASLDGAWSRDVSVEESDGKLVLRSKGLPDHATGRFPNASNPNAIRPQSYRFSLPLDPVMHETAAGSRGYLFGVGLNGVVFDPGTAENWTPDGLQRGGQPTDWTYEAIGPGEQKNLGLDASNAHVQPTGAYHYHGIPTGLLAEHQAQGQMTLIGFAADGWPIYGPLSHRDPTDLDSPLVELRSSYQLKPGSRPSGNAGPGGAYDGTFTQDWQYVAGSGDLDEANGRVGVTPEFPDGTYYYVLTHEFPFVPRMFKGEPDRSFMKRRGPRDTSGRGGPPPRRPGA